MQATSSAGEHRALVLVIAKAQSESEHCLFQAHYWAFHLHVLENEHIRLSVDLLTMQQQIICGYNLPFTSCQNSRSSLAAQLYLHAILHA